MKYFNAKSIIHSLVPYCTLALVPISQFNICILHKTLQTRCFAKTVDLQTINNVRITPNSSPFFLFNFLYVTALIFYGLCIPSLSLATDFSWRTDSSTPPFDNYDEACEFKRVKTENTWKKARSINKFFDTAVSFLQPRSDGACMGPLDFDESGPKRYGCGGPWTIIYYTDTEKVSYAGSCTSVYRVGQECTLPKILNKKKGSCQLPEDNPKNPATSCLTAGNPINILTGNKTLDHTDYKKTGVSPLQFSRHYNSQKTYLYQSTFGSASLTRNPVGIGWYHNYYQGLTVVNSATIKLTRADGQSFLLKSNNGVWSPDADVDFQLEDIRTNNKPRWKVTTPDGTTEIYNSLGELSSITSRYGLNQRLTYRAGLLVNVSDSFGRALIFKYNTAHKLISLTDPNNNVTRYEYDTLNNLSTIIYPDNTPSNLADNPTKKYLYGELTFTENVSQPHALTGIIDENNQRFATYQYNATGKAISTEHATGGINKFNLTYDPTNQNTSVTDPLGSTYTTHYTTILGVLKYTRNDQPAGSGCNASSSALTYDENGNIDSRTDFNGHVTQYDYDLESNLEISRIEAFNTPEQRTTKTDWHPSFRLPVQLDVFDSSNLPLYSLLFDYDTAGRLLTRTETDIESNSSRTTAYLYNAQGLLTTIDGPRIEVADITRFEYDDQSNLVKVINALGHETTLSDYDANGQVQSIEDPNGLISTLTYDPRGWITSSTVDGNTTTFEYDKVGQLIKLTQPDAAYTLYTYDAAHRLIDITDNLGNSIHYTLDAIGNTLKQEIKDDSGNITRVLEREYDQLSRLFLSMGGENQTQHFQYDANGNLTSQTDARNTPADRNLASSINPANQDNTLSSTFDALNRLKISLHHQKSDDASDNISSAYQYNSLDQLVSVTDPNGIQTTYRYNTLGDLLELNSPDTGVTSYTYDAAGNRISQTDARDITVNYAYDTLNRLSSITYPDSSLNISYVYDENNNGQNGMGQMTFMSDASGSTHYRYDKRGNLTTVTTSQGLVILSTNYAYNEVDQIIQITYPSGRIVDYIYDNAGRINNISTTNIEGISQTLITNINYQPFGPVTDMHFGNGLTTQHSFDQDYRQTDIITDTLFDRSYLFDEANNITDISNNLDLELDKSYFYDGLSRLENVQSFNTNIDYQYDKTGNRIGQSKNSQTDSYNYPFDNHHLTNINNNQYYSYDANGNTTQLPNPDIFTQLLYGDHNRLINVNGISYTYNGYGERVKKEYGKGRATGYHYNLTGQLLAETNRLGNTEKEYIYLGSQLIALVSAKSKPTPTPKPTPSTTALQEINVKHRWKTINFENNDSTPIIIAGIPSFNGKQAGVIRIKNVNKTSVKVAFKEWNYLDGKHKTEQVSLLILPSGRHTMPDGSLWETGTFTLNGTKKWHHHTFGKTFPAPPKVFLTAQTANGRDTVTVRAKAITNSTFKAALFEQESKNRSGHVDETIAYLAIYSPNEYGTVEIQGTQLPYQLTTTRVNHKFTSVADHSIKLEEERSKDRERSHIYETVAVLNINGHIFAQDNSSKGGDTVAIRRNSVTPKQDQPQENIQPTATEQASTEQAVYFVHNDHLDTPQVITDDKQNIVWQANYDPFGKAVISTETITNNVRFPGQYFDQETGLHYNYYRYYNPSTGRYITSDPTGLASGLNTYAYVNGNPVNYTDSSGLFIDAIADIGFIAYDLFRLAADNVLGSCNNLGENLNALVADVGGLFIPGATGLGLGVRAAKDVTRRGITVIGRVKDLQKLNKGEKSLLNRLPDKGNPKANWKQNSGVLRQEMGKGKPIRDASPRDTTGQFLNAERNLLESRGWTFNKSTNFWNPPK